MGTMMSDTGVELGPVDYLVVAFPAGQANFSGEMASELAALMESHTVRVLDLLLVTKDADGSVEASCGGAAWLRGLSPPPKPRRQRAGARRPSTSPTPFRPGPCTSGTAMNWWAE